MQQIQAVPRPFVAFIKENLPSRRFVLYWSVFMLAVVLMLATNVDAFAQSVEFDIPIDEYITSTNTWLAKLVTIMAFVTGIPVALAIFGFIGNALIKAFKGA